MSDPITPKALRLKVIETGRCDGDGETVDFLIADEGADAMQCALGKEAIYCHVADRLTADIIVKAVNCFPALTDALSDTLNMLRAAHMQCGVHHDGNKRVIKARATLSQAQGASQ